MNLTLTQDGHVLTETTDGWTFPGDYSFATVNDYVHSVGRHYEELECLCLGMSCHIEKIEKQHDELEKQVDGLINQLSKHQIEAAIGRAVNRACEELPFGYDLHIELEKDAGTISLYRPDGEEVDEEFHDCDRFSGEIDNAINVAIAEAEKGCAA